MKISIPAKWTLLTAVFAVSVASARSESMSLNSISGFGLLIKTGVIAPHVALNNIIVYRERIRIVNEALENSHAKPEVTQAIAMGSIHSFRKSIRKQLGFMNRFAGLLVPSFNRKLKDAEIAVRDGNYAELARITREADEKLVALQTSIAHEIAE